MDSFVVNYILDNYGNIQLIISLHICFFFINEKSDTNIIFEKYSRWYSQNAKTQYVISSFGDIVHEKLTIQKKKSKLQN